MPLFLRRLVPKSLCSDGNFVIKILFCTSYTLHYNNLDLSLLLKTTNSLENCRVNGMIIPHRVQVVKIALPEGRFFLTFWIVNIKNSNRESFFIDVLFYKKIEFKNCHFCSIFLPKTKNWYYDVLWVNIVIWNPPPLVDDSGFVNL